MAIRLPPNLSSRELFRAICRHPRCPSLLPVLLGSSRGGLEARGGRLCVAKPRAHVAGRDCLLVAGMDSAVAPPTTVVSAALVIASLDPAEVLQLTRAACRRCTETLSVVLVESGPGPGITSVRTLALLEAVFAAAALEKPLLDVVPIVQRSDAAASSGTVRLPRDCAVLWHAPGDAAAEEVCRGTSRASDAHPPRQVHALAPVSDPCEPLQVPTERVPEGPMRGSAGPFAAEHVAVGGTFDRLHAGHRLLLAATALLATRRVFVGVTGDKLLASKKYAEHLEPYAAREAAAVRYLREVNPDVEVEAGPLLDPKEPTAAAKRPEMGALVVSRETLPGGTEINRQREGFGFAPLSIVVVGLVGFDSALGTKLSSTEIRHRIALGQNPG